MCHGEIVEVPCSRVAQVYRGPMNVAYTPKASIERSMANAPRIAHTWMDEYKDFFFDRKPDVRYSNLKQGMFKSFKIRYLKFKRLFQELRIGLKFENVFSATVLTGS